MLAMEEREDFCRALSIEAQATQFGTAAVVDAWFALEYDGAWASKAWEAATVPPQVRAHVDAWVDATPGARVQLVRRAERRGEGDVTLLLGNGRQGSACAAEVRLATMDALVDVDLSAAITSLREGRIPNGMVELARPIALVCTNGKRDRCCAKWGVPVYDALVADGRVDVWQTTHLGGHRYAATMVWLPSGVCHGRVAPDIVPALVDALLRGEIGPLELLRGRTSLREAAQAGEYFVRSEHALLGLDDVVIDGATKAGESWEISGRALGEPVTLSIRETTSESVAPPSCGKAAEPVRSWALA
jgi:hypothetical protein